MQNQKKLIIFDLDGTLYELRGGSYKKSPLRRSVIVNAQKYIATKLSQSALGAQQILKNIQKQYGEQISIGLEKEFGIDRYDYFNVVWNIPVRNIVKKESGLRKILLSLRKIYDLAIISDAPQIWIDNVLNELQIQDLFRNTIFSGEGNLRKGFGNAVSSITRVLKIHPSNCIVVGYQEDTDIIPAKKLGMHAVFIHRTKRSLVADICIKSIRELSIMLAPEIFKKESDK